MGKTVFITGGSRGIGAACARVFAQNGYAVAIGYHKSGEQAHALVQGLHALGANACAVPVDVTDRPSVFSAMGTVRARMGMPDTLLLCAGHADQRLFQNISPTQWTHMLDVHVNGAYHCIQAVLPSMLDRQQGTILTFSSIWGQVGGSMEVHYSAAKAAVIGLSRALAKELGPSGIRVNCLSPGVILTDMTLPLGDDTLSALAQETPLCRNGDPDEIARAALFLCSDAASFITGQVLGVNGGLVI